MHRLILVMHGWVKNLQAPDRFVIIEVNFRPQLIAAMSFIVLEIRRPQRCETAYTRIYNGVCWT